MIYGFDGFAQAEGLPRAERLVAAELARAGYSAPEDAFAGEKGYAKAANGKEDLSFMVPRSGDPLMLEDAYYKMHASCGHTHSALDALQALITEERVEADAVEKAEVLVYRTAEKLCGALKTDTEFQAKFSLPYCAACMLKYGQVTLSEFSPERLRDPELLKTAGRITVREEAEYTAAYPSLRTEKVILTLKDGRVLSRAVDLPVGRPPEAFIEKKFFSLAGMTVNAETAERIRDAVLGLKLTDTLDKTCALTRRL